jgi:hypothetical protein
MLEYQKSHGRRTVLGPVVPLVLRHPEDQQPPPARRWVGRGRSAAFKARELERSEGRDDIPLTARWFNKLTIE